MSYKDPLADVLDLIPLVDPDAGWTDDDFLAELEEQWCTTPDAFQVRDVLPAPSDLHTAELLAELTRAQRTIAASQGRSALLITELARRRTSTPTELTGRVARGDNARGSSGLSIEARGVSEEIALELGLSRAAARDLIDTSVGLCLHSERTLAKLLAGELDLAKAAAILGMVQKLRVTQSDTNAELPEAEQTDPEELGRSLEARLLAQVSEQTLDRLKRTGRKAMISANPRAAVNRHRRERTRRHVSYQPDDDSMARLSAYLPADQGLQAKHALTRLALHARLIAGTDDLRTLDQLRVDSLVETLMTAAATLHRNSAQEATKATPADGPKPAESSNGSDSGQSAPGAKPEEGSQARPSSTTTGTAAGNSQIVITMGAATLAGLDDHPAEMEGYGPIIADLARDVAATGTWQCAITDDVHGTLQGLGRSTFTPAYRPTEALRRHLITRDQVCRVPGCNVPAKLCDIDHRVPWPIGSTCECYTECLCGSHHRMKHELGFTLTLSTNPADPPGTLLWGTPAGRHYPSRPAQLQDPADGAVTGPQDTADCPTCVASDDLPPPIGEL